MHRLASLTSSGLGVVTYGYDTYGKLETITRGSTIYTLTYDDWNRPISTKVGSVALSTNTYYDDGKLKKVEYANAFSAHYVYDDLDRVSKIYQSEGNNDEELTYEMIYNGEGDLYEIRNYRTGRASFFEYDHAGRCMASKERGMLVDNNTGELLGYGAILSSYGYQYDECNNLTKLTCSVLGSSWSTVYTYDNDNRPSTTTLASGKVITNTYDAIGRLTNRALGLNTTYNTALTYVPGNATNKTTGLVATYQNGSDAAYSYTYDDVGNITGITQGTTSIGYVYDDANRLIRENNQVTNQTIVYDYENELWGNIQSRTIYAYTTAENPGTPIAPVVTYTYDTSANGWGDQLVEYNGQTITYDEMGNPLTYRGYTFGWRGKQLVSASNGTKTLTFEYNEDGLRQKKTVNNVDTDYFYNGSVLIGMQRGQSKFLFSYDAAGNVVSVKYITANDENEYFYLRNAQNDVVKLIDANGTTVVEYTYDTWGKKVTTTGTLAGTLGLIQPFRYRGYVYDWETGFYYLQSRYYDPQVGRFISADILLSTGQGVLGHNCYAYCLGNPVIYIDTSGCDCYIFFLTGWEDRALNDKLQLMKRYGYDDSQVHLMEFTSKDDFTGKWIEMIEQSNGEVDAIVIHIHGNPNRLGNGKTGDANWNIPSNAILSLNEDYGILNVGWLLLCGCNAGDVDNANTNPANAFASIISGRVYASDGSVHLYTENGVTRYTAVKDKWYKDWKKQRDPKGWVCYFGGHGDYTIIGSDGIVIYNGN